ncbi:nonribosomal peptide synthetase 12 [Lyophyllum atratum]|nr:nonribosomal peptide synthetase 12 [Lyophyllum atratum]
MESRPFNQEQLQGLSPIGRALFNKFGRGETRALPFQCVHQAFEFQARSHPDSVAVEDLHEKITYAQLDRQANCLAAHLREMGIYPGSRVGLLVERSIYMIIGILAVLKAGAAYVPLDGNVVSSSTLTHALRDCDASLVLVQDKFAERVFMTPTLSLEEFVCSHASVLECSKPEELASPDDSAYIIYTSGTTGVPKGVDVMHQNVTNLVCVGPGNLAMSPGLRVSQLMNISFDMAAWEILGSLCNGSTLCLRGKTSKEWRAVMKTIDIMIATPSMLSPHDPADYPNIKVVAVGGEPCPKGLADAWAQSVDFYNCCGPTEVTIIHTMHRHCPGDTLGIGLPTPNNTVYILDEHMKPVKIGDIGIMWAGGAGITKGYLNLPAKTAEVYKLDPFLDDGSMMFNTGDLARWYPNGDLEHLGRVDDQVKVKGFRVELDGVAAAMETTPGIKLAAAILIEGELWGFFTPTSVGIDAVKASASRVQPYYAVPTKYIPMSKFPVTMNGKVDKMALSKLALESSLYVPHSPPLELLTPEAELPKSKTRPPSPILKNHSLAYQAHANDPDAEKVLYAQGGIPGHVEIVLNLPLTKEIDPSSLEDQTSIWAGYKQDILPKKDQGRFMHKFRLQAASLCHRLFGLVFFINFLVLIGVASMGANPSKVCEAVVGNLFVAVLMRQDYVIDAFYLLFTAVPLSWPLWVRKIAAGVHHIGGVHSGAGASSLLWQLYFTIQATKEMMTRNGPTPSGATLAITYVLFLLLLLVLVLAYPGMHKKVHSSFEASHRLLGWGVVILTILLAIDYRSPGQSPGMAVVTSIPFWLLFITILSLALPWVRLRKVDVVYCERVSKQTIRMYFDYITPPAGSLIRVSDEPSTEWHSFATLTEPGKPGFSIVVNRGGEWAKQQIANPATKIWVRGIPIYSVIRIASMFRRLVIVATSSGISPCIPVVLEQKIPIRLLWIASNVRETFGNHLVDAVVKANPEAIIYNTQHHGKPDMVKLTYRLVKEFDAEAVIVMSNKKVTQKIVFEMMSRGIPAFGAT